MTTLVRKRRNGGQVFFQSVGVSALTTTMALLSFSSETSQWAVIRNPEALVRQALCFALRPLDRVPVQAHPPEPVYGQYFRRDDEVRPGVWLLNDAKNPGECSSESRQQTHCDHFSRKKAQKSANAATPVRTQIRIRREQRIQKAAREHAQKAARRAEELGWQDVSEAPKCEQGPSHGLSVGL